ncbi:hypothetical protein [Rhodopila sp.]|uniref:hypothetical protein n=1 Tax=Rhodopila sp. TaxID=2480087 RepID=UPI002C5DA50A|nr:hypothetical protein [Rhodopila sp.]HVZ09660.1 hypothetical protein [Rhodopila sp.]
MPDPDFWTQSAEAMEQTIQGSQLIAAELADLARQLWHMLANQFDGLVSRLTDRRRLPPI